MKRTLSALLALSLLGCASLDGKLQNRVSCSPDGTEAAFTSWYGPVGVAAKIDQRDASICRPRAPG